jgi:hypothetical protein
MRHHVYGKIWWTGQELDGVSGATGIVGLYGAASSMMASHNFGGGVRCNKHKLASCFSSGQESVRSSAQQQRQFSSKQVD